MRINRSIQKEAITLAFEKNPRRALRVDEVEQMARIALGGKDGSKLARITVVRRIEQMVGEGLLCVVEIPGQSDRYQLKKAMRPCLLLDTQTQRAWTVTHAELPRTCDLDSMSIFKGPVPSDWQLT